MLVVLLTVSGGTHLNLPAAVQLVASARIAKLSVLKTLAASGRLPQL